MNKLDYKYKYLRDFDKDTPKLLEYLFNSGKDRRIIKKKIKQGLSLIDQKYDCSDFRIEIFTRILYGYKTIIGKEIETEILNSMQKFPFDDLSNHSMCTWTENHQLILDVSAYLLGNLYPDYKFYNNVDGKELAGKAYVRLNDWCSFIFKFGFSEFGSCNYYPETLGALGNIIEFSKDKELVNKFKIILDLLCFDIFSSITPDLTYNKATARAYVDNKINYFNYLLPHIKALLGKQVKVNHEREACFFLMLKAKDNKNKLIYELPKVFLDIFNSKEKLLIESNGLNIKEYRKNGLLKYNDKNVRYILTSGASSSYITLKNVRRYLKENKMWNHCMFSYLNSYRPLLSVTPCLFPLIRKIKKQNLIDTPYARGNTYTYVKNNYSVSSLTRYQVNKPSFQQVSHMINLDGLSVFTTSPATSKEYMGSPGYWVGSKINPDCIQYKNILVAYYKNPKLTHIYFPLEKFDNVNLEYRDRGLIFARYHNINLMIKTNLGFEFTSSKNDNSIFKDEKIIDYKLKTYDLLNTAKGNHCYLFEVNDTLEFNAFIKDVLNNIPVVNNKKIIYKDFKFKYLKNCYFNKEKVKTSYPRFASRFINNNFYCYNENKPLIISSKNHKLIIDFKNFTRIVK